jgi:Spy/CpxP family protein refolding chaperone
MRTLPGIATSALTLALSLGFAQAQGVPTPAPQGMACPMAKGHGDFAERMAAQLKLTDAQKAGFQAILAKHKDSLASKGKAAKDASKAFFEALRKPETSPDSLKALNRSMSDLRFDQMMEHRAMRQEIRALLTPDQREQAARMEGRMEGMRLARGGGMGMGMGMVQHRRWDNQDAAPEAAPKQP